MTLYEARVHGLYAAARTWSTGYKFNSTALLGTVATAFDDAWTTLWTTATNGYEHLCNADVTVVKTSIRVLNTSLQQLDLLDTDNALAGANVHDSLPFNTSVTVEQFGDSTTKSDRGWMRFPTPSNDMYVADKFTDAFGNSMEAILEPFFASMGSLAGYSAVKINTHTNKQGDPPFTQHVINKWRMSNKPGSVRARTRKTIPTRYVSGTM